MSALRRASRSAALLCAAIVALAALPPATRALAHARFDHSTPSPGQVLPASPASVDIYTVQDMQKTAGAYGITVVHDDNGTPGQEVDSGTAVIDDANRKHFSVALQSNLPPGRYLVSFHNVSDEDGDADHGQFAFYIGNGPTPAQQALDSKLQITSAVAATPTPAGSSASKSGSHAGLYVIVAIVVVLLVVVSTAAFAASRRGRPRI